MKLELNDHERSAVGRSLAERKARLIENAGDTTQPRVVRRLGLLELKVITSVLNKMRLANGAKRDAKADHLPRAAKIEDERNVWHPRSAQHR